MTNYPNTGGYNVARPLQNSGLMNGRLLTGAIVGGAVTYVLTNEAVQRAAISGLAHMWLTLQGGMEEAKERFRDAESEIKAARAK